MKGIFTAWLFITLYASELSLSKDMYSESYIEGDHQFSANKDKQIEANSWAMCNASYSMLAKINENESPAYALKLNQFGNGASVALVMTYYMRMETAENGSTFNQDFARAWRYGQSMKEPLIDVAATHIASNFETEGIDVSLVKLLNTVEICVGNLDLQQAYIDAWRKLREAGIFEE